MVTLGTMRTYSFRRLVDRALAIIPPDVTILWQVGCTDIVDLPIDAHREIEPNVLEQAMREADVVIAHAGAGSAISCLDAGKCPVLVPREASYGENVDDHQREIAGELASRDLCITTPIEELRYEHLVQAAKKSVQVLRDPPPFNLFQEGVDKGAGASVRAQKTAARVHL